MRSIHRSAALVLLPFLALGAATTPAGHAGEPTDPVLLRGQAPAGSDLQVTLQPKGSVLAVAERGDEVIPHELPAEVDQDGSFIVRADIASIPQRYVDEGGVVNVRVFALDGAGAVWSEYTTARAVGASQSWGDPLQQPTVIARSAASSGVSVGELTRLGPAPDGGAARVSARQLCNDRITNRYRTRATVAGSYPAGDRAWVTVQNSTGGKYGVAERQPGQRVRRVGEQYARGGWEWKSLKKRATRHYRAQIGYVEIERRYRDTRGLCQFYFNWEPTVETGGIKTRRTSRPDWRRTRCTGVPQGRWSRVRSDGSPFSFSVGVSSGGFVGINLAVTKQYSRGGMKISYAVRGRKAMCGRGTFPAVAPDVLERRR